MFSRRGREGELTGWEEESDAFESPWGDGFAPCFLPRLQQQNKQEARGVVRSCQLQSAWLRNYSGKKKKKNLYITKKKKALLMCCILHGQALTKAPAHQP